MEINFRILGQSALRIGDHFESDWAQPKPRGMLSVLLLQARRAVPVGELVDWMWPPDKEPRDPASTLRTYRKRIVTALDRMDTPPKIHRRGDTYRLDVDREETDFHVFRRQIARAGSAARQGDYASSARVLASAVDGLWTGLALPDLNGYRAVAWRRKAETEFLVPAYGGLMLSLCKLGYYEEVLHRLAELPLELSSNFTLVKHRLAALHGLHRSDEATGYYLNQRKRLKDNGNLDEADELRRVHDELLSGSTERGAGTSATVQLATAAEVPHGLPHDLPDFVGREELLRQLDASMTPDGQPAATVTVLSGEPGVGKTALAVHWAHRAASLFGGGVLHRDLNGFADRTPVGQREVVADFLMALGVPADGIPSMAGRTAKLRSLLSGPHALVILDNVRDSEHVRELLDCLPCTVLLTSRRRLHGLTRRGAANIMVPPLTEVESKTWLAKWVGTRAGTESASVDHLTRLCSGIALALRIVVDHVLSRPGVPLAEFANELRDEQALLGLGDQKDDPGGTVRAAFSSSYHALDPQEQRLFRLLGTNPGPDISLAAASALFDQEPREAAKGLDRLVDAHLLTQPESRIRYQFHDLLRGYARELVTDSEEQRAAGERLICFYLFSAQNADRIIIPNRDGVTTPEMTAGVSPMKFTDQESAMKWAARERENINSALRLAADRNWHHYTSKLPSIIGEIFQRLGYQEDVAAALRLAIRSAQITDPEDEACLLGNLAFIEIGLREFNSAHENILSARSIFTRIGHSLGIAIMDYHMGRLLVECGQAQRGIDIQLAALAEFRRLDASGQEAVALYRIGESYRRARNLTAAASFLRDALWAVERLEDAHTKGCILAELAATHFESGDITEAEGYCTRALEIIEHIDPAQSGKAYVTLASVYHMRDEYESAERCARRALTCCREARDVRGQAQALRMIAELAYRKARHEEARESWSLALSLLETTGERQAAAAVRERLTETAASPAELPLGRTERGNSRNTNDSPIEIDVWLPR